jgi:hypothetical protein
MQNTYYTKINDLMSHKDWLTVGYRVRSESATPERGIEVTAREYKSDYAYIEVTHHRRRVILSKGY